MADSRKRYGNLPPHSNFGHVAKEGSQRIKVPRCKGIIFVIMALSTTKSHTQEYYRKIAYAIRLIDGSIFFWLRPSFFGGHIKPIKTGGNQLPTRRPRQQISGHLVSHKLIIRKIVIEGLDHPVTIRRVRTEIVAVNSHRIGITHYIKPIHGHPFAKVRRLEQVVHIICIGSWGTVGNKGFDILCRGWQADQIE